MVGLEPGMLRVFRLYAWVQIASKIFLPLHLLRERMLILVKDVTAQTPGLLALRLQPTDLGLPALVAILHMAALLALLYVPWLQRRLGRYTIPTALAVTSLGLILEQHLFQRQGIFSQLYPFITVVLIMIAWQYGFRWVAAFLVGTTALVVLLQFILPAPMILPSSIIGWQQYPVMGFLFSLPLTFLLVGYVVSQLAAAQRKQRQTLAEANQKLVSHAATLEQLTESRERMRLSRELHDTLAHTLSAMAVQIEALQTVAEGMQPKARRILDQIQDETHSGLDETRRALAALRASPLEDLGLASALAALAQDTAGRANLTLKLETPEAVDDLPLEVEQSFYRVAQEALANAAQHARAANLEVRLRRENGRLFLTIRDDGEGFSSGISAETSRFGLRGMHERAELIGANLTIDSQSGQGTTVQMTWEAQP